MLPSVAGAFRLPDNHGDGNHGHHTRLPASIYAEVDRADAGDASGSIVHARECAWLTPTFTYSAAGNYALSRALT